MIVKIMTMKTIFGLFARKKPEAQPLDPRTVDAAWEFFLSQAKRRPCTLTGLLRIVGERYGRRVKNAVAARQKTEKGLLFLPAFVGAPEDIRHLARLLRPFVLGLGREDKAAPKD